MRRTTTTRRTCQNSHHVSWQLSCSSLVSKSSQPFFLFRLWQEVPRWKRLWECPKLQLWFWSLYCSSLCSTSSSQFERLNLDVSLLWYVSNGKITRNEITSPPLVRRIIIWGYGKVLVLQQLFWTILMIRSRSCRWQQTPKERRKRNWVLPYLPHISTSSLVLTRDSVSHHWWRPHRPREHHLPVRKRRAKISRPDMEISDTSISDQNDIFSVSWFWCIILHMPFSREW